MKKVIRKEAFYPHPPEKVWIALTDPHALAEWFMPNDFKPIVGHKFRFQTDPLLGFSGILECELLVADKPRCLSWSGIDVPKDPTKPRSSPTTVTWTLNPEQEGTRLVLEHTGVEVIVWWHRLLLRLGWGTMLKKYIPKILANIDENGFHPGAIPLEKRGYKCKTISPELIK